MHGCLNRFESSLPVGLEEFLGQSPVEILFVDETHALRILNSDDGSVQYQLFVVAIDKAALMTVTFTEQPDAQTFDQILPAMLSFQRTPLSEEDFGDPAEGAIEAWFAQLESSPPDAQPLDGNIAEAARCMAAAFASDQIARYGSAVFSSVDPADPLEVQRLGHLLADLEEVLAVCGLPPNLFDTLS